MVRGDLNGQREEQDSVGLKSIFLCLLFCKGKRRAKIPRLMKFDKIGDEPLGRRSCIATLPGNDEDGHLREIVNKNRFHFGWCLQMSFLFSRYMALELNNRAEAHLFKLDSSLNEQDF